MKMAVAEAAAEEKKKAAAALKILGLTRAASEARAGGDVDSLFVTRKSNNTSVDDASKQYLQNSH